MSNVTVESVDLALANAPADLPIDDRALLWIMRAHLLGQPITPEHLVYLIGVTVDEALDIFARLAEQGLLDSDDADSDTP